IASAQDRQIVADAFSFIPAERIISRSRIRDLMALIDHSRFFMGNDSGPAHIAEALGIPKLVIYPDDPENFARWAPLQPDRCLALRQSELNIEASLDRIESFISRYLTHHRSRHPVTPLE
ncbi:MAG: hypothetical protein KBA26_01450, partial [Candidatus Delongbacteria bacterium]|nr:hypothetical protein [Candidatus Delongbacteria bacterium]